MGFLNKIFKKEKKAKKDTSRGPAEISKIRPAQEKTEPGKIILGVLRRPHLTEKSSAISGRGQYIFSVRKEANKISVKNAVEARYGVSVVYVNITNLPGKTRTRGRQIGWKPGLKKAVVTLKKGESIDIQ